MWENICNVYADNFANDKQIPASELTRAEGVWFSTKEISCRRFSFSIFFLIKIGFGEGHLSPGEWLTLQVA